MSSSSRAERDSNLTEEERTELHALLESDHFLDHVRGFVTGLWAVFEVGQTAEQSMTRLKALWNYEAPEGGGDTHVATVRGSRSRVEVRQGAEQRWRPELYVVPNRPAEAPAVKAAVERRIAGLARVRPGLTVEGDGALLHVAIPDRYRVGHEPHFAEVTERFLGYLKDPASLPKWERANMLAKYWVTTKAVELSR